MFRRSEFKETCWLIFSGSTLALFFMTTGAVWTLGLVKFVQWAF